MAAGSSRERSSLDKPAPVVLAIASGKGGVGKSTVCLNVGVALTEGGVRVGILDADVYGPDIPLMVGLTRRVPGKSVSLARARRRPIERFGVQIMSTQFLISESQPIAWDRHLVDLLLDGFFSRTDWGALDVLLVDLPPGTADLQKSLAKRMPVTGVVVVVTPQDLAHLDAKKAIAMFESAGVRLVGGVENMAGLECHACGAHLDVFPRVAHERSIWAAGVELLGSVPLTPAVSAAAESGRPVVLTDPGSPAAVAFAEIAASLRKQW